MSQTEADASDRQDTSASTIRILHRRKGQETEGHLGRGYTGGAEKYG